MLAQTKNWIYDHPYLFYLTLFLCGLLAYAIFSPKEVERDSRGRTPLYLAAEVGDYQKVEQLLDDGALIDECDDCRWTPLMRAAQNGHIDVIRLLLEKGADVNNRDKGGYSILMVAAGDNHTDVIKLLVKHGSKLDIQDSTAAWTALIWAAKEGHAASVSALLTSGANQNIKDKSGKTALDWARIKGHQEIIRLLQPLPSAAIPTYSNTRPAVPATVDADHAQ